MKIFTARMKTVACIASKINLCNLNVSLITLFSCANNQKSYNERSQTSVTLMVMDEHLTSHNLIFLQTFLRSRFGGNSRLVAKATQAAGKISRGRNINAQ